MLELQIEESFLDRDIFVGFSGGEKRKIEILQIELFQPRCIILDEVDSGLDIDAVQLLVKKIHSWNHEGKKIIIISHNFHLLESIQPSEYVLFSD
jgi:Fe-S cluster assembly ATP-binding protein